MNKFNTVLLLIVLFLLSLNLTKIANKINLIESKLSTIQLQTSLQNWNYDPMRVKSPNGLLMKKNNG